MEEIITVKQLPIIEEKLRMLSADIDTKVENATSLIVSDETVKEVKKMRADLNKDFKELESQRKKVKETVLAPYNAFEELYRECVTNKFKEADSTLKQKIDEVENVQKQEKEDEVKQYFNELVTREELGFIRFEQIGINVTLSASIKSLKEDVKKFVEKVIAELKTIETQEHKDEILVEYMKTLDLNHSIQEVSERHVALEKQKEQREAKKEQELTDQEMIQKIDALAAPKVEKQEEIMTMTFTVRGTLEKLKAVLINSRKRN